LRPLGTNHVVFDRQIAHLGPAQFRKAREHAIEDWISPRNVGQDAEARGPLALRPRDIMNAQRRGRDTEA
jgi:hypothetical protein